MEERRETEKIKAEKIEAEKAEKIEAAEMDAKESRPSEMIKEVPDTSKDLLSLEGTLYVGLLIRSSSPSKIRLQ